MKVKDIKDPAIYVARKAKDKDFERSGWSWDKSSSVKEFGRNKLLSGKHKKR